MENITKRPKVVCHECGRELTPENENEFELLPGHGLVVFCNRCLAAHKLVTIPVQDIREWFNSYGLSINGIDTPYKAPEEPDWDSIEWDGVW